MRVRVQAPDRTLLEQEADRVVVESVAGSFCLEPRHVDYAAGIVDGILTVGRGGEERFLGTGEGVLVKVGDEVLVSVRDAVTDAPLGRLREAVERRARDRGGRADAMRRAADRLESALVQRFAELADERGGRA